MYHEWREFSFCARRALSQLGRWSLTRNAPRLLNAFLPRHHPLLACLLFDRAPLNAFQLEGPLFFRLSNKKNRSSQKAMLSRMNFCGGFISLTETDVFHISAETRKAINFCVISLTEMHVFNIQKYGPSRISVAVSFSLRKFMVSAFPRKKGTSWISVKRFHFPDGNSCFPRRKFMNFCSGFISLTETDVFHISAEIRKGMNFCSGVISLTEIHVFILLTEIHAFNIQKYGPSWISVAVSFSLRKFMVSAFPRKNRNSWISVKWFHFPDRNSCFPHLYGKTEIHEFL